MRWYRADLHIHTCLSPCGDLAMTPSEIVKRAKMKGLDIIGICDHNSSKNVPYVIEAASSEGIKVIPGVEVTSSEEVHILSLFEDVESAFEMESLILSTIEDENVEEVFGIQAIVNAKNEVVGIERKLLIGASNFTVDRVVEVVHSFGGLAIASHIDKEAFSIIAKLGFIPEDLKLDGVEVSRYGLQAVGEYRDFTVIASSDAHYPEEIGTVWTAFYLDEPTFSALEKSIKNKRGIMVNG